jgi:ribokinase
MAAFLRKLLDAKEPMFSLSLRHLEKITGHKGVDVAYIADITHRAHSVMRSMGLDTADTKPLELYRALGAHADDVQLFQQTDDVALIFAGDEVVSFNHDDVRQNKKLPYEQRTVKHMRLQVQRGLMARYVAADGDDEMMIEELVSQAGINVHDIADDREQKPNKAEQSMKPSILFIGDIFTDVFIRLLEDEARIDIDKDGSKRLSIPFGSKPPYAGADIVYSVGPSPNAAVSCARLGAAVSLMSWLGDDQVGKDSLKYLAHELIDTQLTVSQKKTPSNTYYVLRYGADRTILVKNEDYRYVWKAPAQAPDWIYLSLISEDSWLLHQELLDYLDDHPNTKLAFQPGTFHFKWGAKKLHKIYKRAEITIMNREEAVDVTGADYDSLRDLANGLHKLGPKYVVITDGPNGSYASFDGKLVSIPNYPDPAPPLDRTGAGDAFASTIVAALALGETMETALTWAPINSMSVVQKLGAQAGLLRLEELKKFLAKAPVNYKVQELK